MRFIVLFLLSLPMQSQPSEEGKAIESGSGNGSFLTPAQSETAAPTPFGIVATAPAEPAAATSVIEAYSGSSDLWNERWWGPRKLLQNGYFESEFLYFRVNNPRNNGGTIGARVTQTVGTTVVSTTDTLQTTQNYRYNYEAGFRMLLGRRVNDLWSVELGGFWLNPERHNRVFNFGTQTGNTIAGTNTSTVTTSRPFFAPTNDTNFLQTTSLWQIDRYGMEANGRILLLNREVDRLEGITGLRWLAFNEVYDQSLTRFTRDVIRERFETSTHVLAPQIGLDYFRTVGEYVQLKFGTKAAFGPAFQQVEIARVTGATGALTGPNNLGQDTRTSSATILDFNTGVIFRLTPNFSIQTGWNFIYLSNGLRAQDQLDLPGATARNPYRGVPRASDIWLSGFNLGIDWRY